MVALVEDRAKADAMLSDHAELLNARWMNDETALHYWAIEGAGEVVHFLASRGADVNAVNGFGDTALVDVATLGLVAIAAILLQYGADPNACSRYRDTALHAAARRGSAELIDLLLKAGADGHYRTHLDETVFDAVRENPEEDQAALRAVLAAHGLRDRSDEPDDDTR